MTSARFTDELTEFIESGVSTLIGTRDAALRPECLRAAGTTVDADRRGLTVLVPHALAARTLANLADNGQIAITFSRPMDHRTLQVKGVLLDQRAATDAEHALQERYLASLVEQLYWCGLPRSLVRRLRTSPAIALHVRADTIFVQTPGPGAGRKLEAAP